ncbi:MAG: hypothetical protein Q9182_001946 [Xanthomendoza sp. 2 TL-2023]
MIRSTLNNFHNLTFGLLATKRKEVDAHLDPERPTKRPRNTMATQGHDTTTTGADGSLASNPDTSLHNSIGAITIEEYDPVISPPAHADIDTSASGSDKAKTPVVKTAIKRAATNHDLKASTEVVASGHAWPEQLRNLQHHVLSTARVMMKNILPVAAAGDGTAVPVPERQPVFPLMKLPRELRDMVYASYFHPLVQHSKRCRGVDHDPCSRWHWGGPPCLPQAINNDAPLGSLWIVSKRLYNEAMPIYFTTHHFCFSGLETLGRFITTIGPFPRQYIAKVNIHWEKSSKISTFDVHQTFRLLSECPNLKSLTFNIPPNYLLPAQYRPLPGQKTALQIRGLQDVAVKVYPHNNWILEENFAEARSRFAALGERLSVLKTPYTDAEIKRREALGIIKKETYRTCFDGEEKESRAERYKKRKLLKNFA